MELVNVISGQVMPKRAEPVLQKDRSRECFKMHFSSHYLERNKQLAFFTKRFNRILGERREKSRRTKAQPYRVKRCPRCQQQHQRHHDG